MTSDFPNAITRFEAIPESEQISPVHDSYSFGSSRTKVNLVKDNLTYRFAELVGKLPEDQKTTLLHHSPGLMFKTAQTL